MKFPKMFLAVPLLFSVVSCGSTEENLAGTYSFQLGSQEGTHAAIHLNLLKEAYKEDAVKKKFTLEFDLGGNSELAGIFDILGKIPDFINGETSEGDSSSQGATSEYTTSEGTSESTPAAITGYYYVDDAALKEGQIIHLGVDLFGVTEISPSVMEKLIYATYASDTITVSIPVSITDLAYQLYWYGYRIGSISDIFEPVSLLEKDPAFFTEVLKGNDLGTHPTPEVVAKIQQYQKDRKEAQPEDYETFEDYYTSFRNYHTLKMGLKKNG